MVKRKKIDIDFDWSTIEGSTENHNEFKRQFTVCVPKEFINSMVLPYDVAFVRTYSQPEICFHVGQKGVLDTIVEIPNASLFFDMKTGKAKLSPLQKNFVKMMKEIKGVDVAFKITSVRQGLNIIRGFYGEENDG